MASDAQRDREGRRPAAEAGIMFGTELGWIAVASRGEVLTAVVFGYPSRERAERVLADRCGGQFDTRGGSRWLGHVAELLTAYAASEEVGFSGITVDDEHLTPFGRRVVGVCRSIARGQVRSYGELAAACGAARSARGRHRDGKESLPDRCALPSRRGCGGLVGWILGAGRFGDEAAAIGNGGVLNRNTTTRLAQ